MYRHRAWDESVTAVVGPHSPTASEVVTYGSLQPLWTGQLTGWQLDPVFSVKTPSIIRRLQQQQQWRLAITLRLSYWNGALESRDEVISFRLWFITANWLFALLASQVRRQRRWESLLVWGWDWTFAFHTAATGTVASHLTPAGFMALSANELSG